MISLLSYNVEYGKNLDQIYKWIASLDLKPQIICLQEFPEKEIENLEKNKLHENQLVHFAQGLSNKDEIFGELTIIDSSSIKVLKVNYLDFGRDNLESFYKRKVIKRSAIINELKISDKTFSLANVHLTPLSLHGYRRKQLSKVIEKTALESSVIVGDFNYSSLLNRNGLITFMEKFDYKLAGEKLVTNKYKYKIPQQLDYVFYKNMDFSEMKVFDLPYSDHFPVLATFEV